MSHRVELKDTSAALIAALLFCACSANTESNLGSDDDAQATGRDLWRDMHGLTVHAYHVRDRDFPIRLNISSPSYVERDNQRNYSVSVHSDLLDGVGFFTHPEGGALDTEVAQNQGRSFTLTETGRIGQATLFRVENVLLWDRIDTRYFGCADDKVIEAIPDACSSQQGTLQVILMDNGDTYRMTAEFLPNNAESNILVPPVGFTATELPAVEGRFIVPVTGSFGTTFNGTLLPRTETEHYIEYDVMGAGCRADSPITFSANISSSHRLQRGDREVIRWEIIGDFYANGVTTSTSEQLYAPYSEGSASAVTASQTWIKDSLLLDHYLKVPKQIRIYHPQEESTDSIHYIEQIDVQVSCNRSVG